MKNNYKIKLKKNYVIRKIKYKLDQVELISVYIIKKDVIYVHEGPSNIKIYIII